MTNHIVANFFFEPEKPVNIFGFEIKCFTLNIKLYFVVFSLFIWLSTGFSSVIYTSISQDSLTVGDRIELNVSLVVPNGAQIIPPETEEGFSNFVVKNWISERDERKSSDSVTFKYIITLYTVEPCSIPALSFIEIHKETQDTLFSDPIPMRVISVITGDKGDTIRLKDIKPQQSAGTKSFLWLWIILGIIFVIGTIFLCRYIFIKSRKPPPPPPPKPPYEEAIEALKRLESKQYLMKGLVRFYVFELSGILKRYIGRRFEAHTLEYTTEEIMQWLPSAPFDASLRVLLEWFFNTTHPVKFAKIRPDDKTVKQLYDKTLSFIEKTKPGVENEQNSEEKANQS